MAVLNGIVYFTVAELLTRIEYLHPYVVAIVTDVIMKSFNRRPSMRI